MTDVSNSQQVVVFSLADEEYALPISTVHEIIRYTEPRSVAARDPWMRGVISLRGKIVRVYDLATRLGLSAEPSMTEEQAASAKIIIVETADDMAGVVVDSVEEVMTIPGEQIEPSPIDEVDSIAAIAKVDDRLIVMLTAEGIFGSRTAARKTAKAA